MIVDCWFSSCFRRLFLMASCGFPAWSFSRLIFPDQNLADQFCMLRTLSDFSLHACCVCQSDSAAATPKRRSRSAVASKWLFCMVTSSTSTTANTWRFLINSFLHDAAQRVLQNDIWKVNNDTRTNENHYPKGRGRTKTKKRFERLNIIYRDYSAKMMMRHE